MVAIQPVPNPNTVPTVVQLYNELCMYTAVISCLQSTTTTVLCILRLTPVALAVASCFPRLCRCDPAPTEAKDCKPRQPSVASITSKALPLLLSSSSSSSSSSSRYSSPISSSSSTPLSSSPLSSSPLSSSPLSSKARNGGELQGTVIPRIPCLPSGCSLQLHVLIETSSMHYPYGYTHVITAAACSCCATTTTTTTTTTTIYYS